VGADLINGTSTAGIDIEELIGPLCRYCVRMSTNRISAAEIAALPRAEFAFPGPLRDRLVAAILNGRKTATTGLVADYEHGQDPLPRPGDRDVVIDSTGRPVAIIVTTEVSVVALSEVGFSHVLAEGEGDRTVTAWRSSHEEFWCSEAMRDALEDLDFIVDDATMVVLQRFKVVADLRGRFDD
jgi:uncharacterized protein YhfF